MLINQIKLVQSRKELRLLLSSQELLARHQLLMASINSLNDEIELSLASNVDVAIFKMSQVVMLEDEKHIVERLILKQGILV